MILISGGGERERFVAATWILTSPNPHTNPPPHTQTNTQKQTQTGVLVHGRAAAGPRLRHGRHRRAPHRGLGPVRPAPPGGRRGALRICFACVLPMKRTERMRCFSGVGSSLGIDEARETNAAPITTPFTHNKNNNKHTPIAHITHSPPHTTHTTKPTQHTL